MYRTYSPGCDIKRSYSPISRMIIPSGGSRIIFECNVSLIFQAKENSYFQLYEELNDIVIGKTISSVVKIATPEEQRVLYRIIFTDHSDFKIWLVGNGGLEIINAPASPPFRPALGLAPAPVQAPGKLVIVIGLPGSGKTNYINSAPKSALKFDDFIGTFCTGELMSSSGLGSGLECYISDSRLCNYMIFKDVMSRINSRFKVQDLKLVLFNNDVKSCIDNVRRKHSKNATKKIVEDIIAFSHIYLLNNYKMTRTEAEAEVEVRPVYRP